MEYRGGAVMEACYYRKLEDGAVECQLCTHGCVLQPGEMGICKCRVNDNGTLIAKTYGEISGMTTENLIEMGFYFYPNKELKLLSISAYGCNMNCPYCINHHISQGRIHTEHLEPDELVQRLQNLHRSRGVSGVCYTFNEPLVWFEHVRDYSQVVREAGYMNALETNGMINPEAFKILLATMDMVNVDYKAFDSDTYCDYLMGDMENVLENIGILAESGVYYEVTCLIVADVNDDEARFEQGMQRLKEVAPDAPVNLLGVVQRSIKDDFAEPSLEKMNALYDIAKRYFAQVQIVERDKAPQW